MYAACALVLLVDVLINFILGEQLDKQGHKGGFALGAAPVRRSTRGSGQGRVRQPAQNFDEE